MRRYDTEYAKLKALLNTGQLGRPLMLHNRHRNVATPPGFTSEMLINDSVVHEMDITRWLLGQEITAVTVLKPTPSGNAPEGLQDPQFVVFETDGGAVVRRRDQRQLRLRVPGAGRGGLRTRHGPHR